jgi:hypothetical protein
MYTEIFLASFKLHYLNCCYVHGWGAKQVGSSRVRVPMRSLNFSIYLILKAALGGGVHSVSNRNEYQKQKNVSGK